MEEKIPVVCCPNANSQMKSKTINHYQDPQKTLFNFPSKTVSNKADIWWVDI